MTDEQALKKLKKLHDEMGDAIAALTGGGNIPPEVQNKTGGGNIPPGTGN